MVGVILEGGVDVEEKRGQRQSTLYACLFVFFWEDMFNCLFAKGFLSLPLPPFSDNRKGLIFMRI